jgi:hypothetical protein
MTQGGLAFRVRPRRQRRRRQGLCRSSWSRGHRGDDRQGNSPAHVGAAATADQVPTLRRRVTTPRVAWRVLKTTIFCSTLKNAVA